MGLPILLLWVTRSSLLSLNFACCQTRQPRWTLAIAAVTLFTRSHWRKEQFLYPPVPASVICFHSHCHSSPAAILQWWFFLVSLCHGLGGVVQCATRSRESLLSRGGSSRIRRGVHQIEQRQTRVPRKSPQIKHAAEETRSAQARSRYVFSQP